MQAEGLVETEEEMIGKRVRIYYKLTKTGKQKAQIQVTELLSFLDTIQQLILPDKPLAHG
jgi:DNA-binding PadR family transcriptional regulator